MALVAPVEDGKIVESASQSSLNKVNASGGSDMDKDSFLQLLVAQMKYQDPLEPTSNTEYISQYAQFSQVEQMQNMAGSMDLQRASQLVGEEVYIKTTGSDGETKYVQGKVDYVVYENGKAYLSINESLYSIDDLDTVVDRDYQSAYNKAEKFIVSINKLPAIDNVDESDLEKIDELKKTYDEMTDYEKSFIATDKAADLQKYVEKAEEIRAEIEEEKLQNQGKVPETEESNTEEPGNEGNDTV